MIAARPACSWSRVLREPLLLRWSPMTVTGALMVPAPSGTFAPVDTASTVAHTLTLVGRPAVTTFFRSIPPTELHHRPEAY